MLGFEWKCFDAQRLYFWPISQGQKMDHQAKTDKTFQTIHFLFKNSIKPKKISRIRIVQRTVVQFADFFNKLPPLLYHMLSLSADWENT